MRSHRREEDDSPSAALVDAAAAGHAGSASSGSSGPRHATIERPQVAASGRESGASSATAVNGNNSAMLSPGVYSASTFLASNMVPAMAASPVQMAALDGALVQFRRTVLARSGADVQATAATGMAGSAGAIPYMDRIQQAFGRHDIRHVQAYTGGAAEHATRQLGARAYASGDSVVLGSQGRDLHTVAHEAAHVVQQRGGVALKGGVGQSGDRYERHADAVADAVVAGRSAETLLDRFAGTGGASVARQAVQFQRVQAAGPAAKQVLKGLIRRATGMKLSIIKRALDEGLRHTTPARKVTVTFDMAGDDYHLEMLKRDAESCRHEVDVRNAATQARGDEPTDAAGESEGHSAGEAIGAGGSVESSGAAGHRSGRASAPDTSGAAAEGAATGGGEATASGETQAGDSTSLEGATAEAETEGGETEQAEEIPSNTVIYEQIAHNLAYKDRLTNEDQQMLQRWGYGRGEPARGTGDLQMLAVQGGQGEPNRKPVVAFRGTLEIPDFIEDGNAEGVGMYQYSANEALIVGTMRRLGGSVDLTGHSLGGTLAQITAANHPGMVRRVRTFQATGVSHDLAARMRNSDQGQRVDVEHHVADGDVVSEAGDEHLDGRVRRYDVDSGTGILGGAATMELQRHRAYLATEAEDARHDGVVRPDHINPIGGGEVVGVEDDTSDNLEHRSEGARRNIAGGLRNLGVWGEASREDDYARVWDGIRQDARTGQHRWAALVQRCHGSGLSRGMQSRMVSNLAGLYPELKQAHMLDQGGRMPASFEDFVAACGGGHGAEAMQRLRNQWRLYGGA